MEAFSKFLGLNAAEGLCRRRLAIRRQRGFGSRPVFSMSAAISIVAPATFSMSLCSLASTAVGDAALFSPAIEVASVTSVNSDTTAGVSVPTGFDLFMSESSFLSICRYPRTGSPAPEGALYVTTSQIHTQPYPEYPCFLF